MARIPIFPPTDSRVPEATTLDNFIVHGYQDGVTKKARAEMFLMNSTAYGVRIDSNVSNPALTRLGNPVLHQALPIQSLMRRCVVKVEGTINYYLNENNSLLREDGAVANLDGSDGDVMVEIPEFWYRVDKVSATASEIWISQTKLPGFRKNPRMLGGAFEAAYDRVNSTLHSVINMSPDFRGGNNNAAYDGTYRTFLGRPVTYISRVSYTAAARRKSAAGKNGVGWNQMTYDFYKTILMLYYIEYANLNSQLPFNASLDANGFRQGGLGDGVTTLSGAPWSNFNGQYPFIPCGYTRSLGNNSGTVPFTMPVEYDAGQQPVLDVPSYRGIENPFGHIYKWIEGINVRVQADDSGGRSTVFATDNPTLFNYTDYNGYREVGDTFRSNTYIREMIMGPYFDMMGKTTVGAGSTTFYCDIAYYGSLPSTGESLRGVFVGGNANLGANAGLALTYSYHVPTSARASVGARLCFLPE